MRKLTVLWQRPLTCWAWILRVSLSALDHCHIPEPRTAVVIDELMLAKQGITNINAYMDTQLPFGYVHLMTLLVNVQNFIMALKAGVLFADAISTSDVDLMVQQLVSTVVVAFIYQGFLQISYLIACPFGDEVTHFPMSSYINYVASVVDATYEAQSSCPRVAENGKLHRPDRKRAARRQQQQPSRERIRTNSSSAATSYGQQLPSNNPSSCTFASSVPQRGESQNSIRPLLGCRQGVEQRDARRIFPNISRPLGFNFTSQPKL